MEIDGDNIGPESVFKASGHVDNFADLSVTCKACGESFRADHLAKGLHPNPDSLSMEELQKVLRDNDVRCQCDGEFADVEEFNLMFKTKIGPGGGRTGYLRPGDGAVHLRELYQSVSPLPREASVRLHSGRPWIPQ